MLVTPFPTMFSTLSQTNFAILATIKFSSANVLNSDISNLLSFGKELKLMYKQSCIFKTVTKNNHKGHQRQGWFGKSLTHSHTMTPFDASGKQAF